VVQATAPVDLVPAVVPADVAIRPVSAATRTSRPAVRIDDLGLGLPAVQQEFTW
jgi:hypothetical protein